LPTSPLKTSLHLKNIHCFEARHGVDIGAAYVNENAGKTFCAYIAESRRKALREVVNSAKFYSILMDGSTDVANVDDEVFLLQWRDVDK